MAVIKTIDLVGVSSESWRDAAHQALSEAAKTIRGIESMDILGTSAVVASGTISEYHTQVRISFRIDLAAHERVRGADRLLLHAGLRCRRDPVGGRGQG